MEVFGLSWESQARSLWDPWKVGRGAWASGHPPLLAGSYQVPEQVQGADGDCAEGPGPAGPPEGRWNYSSQLAAGGQRAEC